MYSEIISMFQYSLDDEDQDVNPCEYLLFPHRAELCLHVGAQPVNHEDLYKI